MTTNGPVLCVEGLRVAAHRRLPLQCKQETKKQEWQKSGSLRFPSISGTGPFVFVWLFIKLEFLNLLATLIVSFASSLSSAVQFFPRPLLFGFVSYPIPQFSLSVRR